MSRRQDGFKAHLSVDPDTGIITNSALTKASGVAADGQPVSEPSVGLDLLETEDEPVTVLGDSAYGSGEFRDELGVLVTLLSPAAMAGSVSAQASARRYW